MREFTGTIKAITTVQGSQGEYHKLNFPPLGGQKYDNIFSVFPRKTDSGVVNLMEGIKTGDTVTLVLGQGKEKPNKPGEFYENVVAIKKTTTPLEPTPQIAGTTPSRGGDAESRKERNIARAVALKAAVEDLAVVPHSPQEVIDTADVFLAWLER